MSKSWDKGSGIPYEQAPTGIHTGVLVRILDLGTQEGEYKGEKTVKRQTHLTWELPTKLRDDGQPFTISKFYTASLGETANLYKDLTSWFGKPPTTPFNPESLLGKNCKLVIVERNDKHVVSAIAALPDDEEAKAPVNDTMHFSLDAFDDELFSKVPGGLQKIIQKSPEYATIMAGDFASTVEETANDDIPF